MRVELSCDAFRVSPGFIVATSSPICVLVYCMRAMVVYILPCQCAV